MRNDSKDDTLNRSGIEQLVALRDEFNSAVDRILRTDVALPSLDDTNFVPTAPSSIVVQAAYLAKEMVAPVQGSGRVLEMQARMMSAIKSHEKAKEQYEELGGKSG
ncbi:hypothetical protein JCM11641_000906 [Rhodosporidiobolus odoratus]